MNIAGKVQHGRIKSIHPLLDEGIGGRNANPVIQAQKIQTLLYIIPIGFIMTGEPVSTAGVAKTVHFSWRLRKILNPSRE